MRLIDADALTEKCGDWYVGEGTAEGFIGTLGQLLSGQPEINCSDIPNNSDTISRQMAIDVLEERLQASGYSNVALVSELNRSIGYLMRLPSVQPESKAVFNRDIAIEAICDEVMLWFDISATKAYEIADTVVKRIEVRMEKTERGKWILDRSGAYCCDKCMEPCATYAMMKPRDKFCKMCGAKMDGERKE